MPPPAAGAAEWEGHTDGGVYYCFTPPITSTGVLIFWAATPPAGLPPDPAQLARQAVASMGLKAITIGIVPEPKPGSIGLVGMPSWMWVSQPSPNTWGPQTRSASAGGVTVTATAKVDRVVWRMGDGGVVSCLTPGTPYRDVYGRNNSPDCGYRYRRTSVGQPGQAYTVTATSYWKVTWAGGGQTGTIDLDFTADTQIRVGEMQVLVTH